MPVALSKWLHSFFLSFCLFVVVVVVVIVDISNYSGREKSQMHTYAYKHRHTPVSAARNGQRESAENETSVSFFGTGIKYSSKIIM